MRKGFAPSPRFRLRLEFLQPVEPPVYQSIASAVALMHDRGVRVSAIAKHFCLDDHTAAKALRWFRSRSPAVGWLLSLSTATRLSLDRSWLFPEARSSLGCRWARARPATAARSSAPAGAGPFSRIPCAARFISSRRRVLPGAFRVLLALARASRCCWVRALGLQAFRRATRSSTHVRPIRA